jgi:hypothetical protein
MLCQRRHQRRSVNVDTIDVVSTLTPVTLRQRRHQRHCAMSTPAMLCPRRTCCTRCTSVRCTSRLAYDLIQNAKLSCQLEEQTLCRLSVVLLSVMAPKFLLKQFILKSFFPPETFIQQNFSTLSLMLPENKLERLFLANITGLVQY